MQAGTLYPELDPYDHANLKGIFSSEVQRELRATRPQLRDEKEDEIVDDVLKRERSSPSKHLEAYLRYLTNNRRFSVTVVVDNIDRGTEAFEKFAVLFARRLTREAGATTITALRGTTYLNHRDGGFLDVSLNTVFTISPPAFHAVAAKRIKYVRERLRDDAKLMQRLTRELNDFPLERVLEFVEVLSEMVLDESRDISFAIQALAGTNVRLALDFLREFSTSPWTDVDRLMTEYNAQNFRQPLAYFLRATMRDGRHRYEEARSRIFNVFQVDHSYLENHFCCIRILQLLEWRSRHARLDVDIPINEVAAALRLFGNEVSSTRRVLDAMGKRGLVSSRTESEPPWSDNALLRLGSSGEYYLETLVYCREYLENILNDTVVYDQDTHASLIEIHRNKELKANERARRKLELFLAYLVQRENEELEEAPVKGYDWAQPVASGIVEKILGIDALQGMSSTQRRPSRRKKPGARRRRQGKGTV